MYRLVLFWTLAVALVEGKIYDACQLADELLNKHQVPREQLATWVCIAYHESRYNTSAVNLYNWDGSNDHGIFQLNNRYWCHPGTGCNLSCDRLLDDDISDDVACARTVYKQTASFAGDGFSAWAVYHKCKDGAADEYVSNCVL